MPLIWVYAPLLALLWSTTAVLADPTFENTAVVRTVDLGGSVVHVTTTYAVKALAKNANVYTVALGEVDRARTSWIEAKLKGENEPLAISERQEDEFSYVDIALPQTVPVNKSINLVVETVQTHATTPWPETAAQKDVQKLKYSTNLFVTSPYPTSVQRTKLRAMSPHIVSFTEPKDVGSSATKSGSTVTYGPFSNIPASTNADFSEKFQQPITIHYRHDQPVLEVLEYKRFAEVSHWGANLNIQDDITLHNAGPKLKGHFSRLEYQRQAYLKQAIPHMLPALLLNLPAGIRDAYYYDKIGNVSTSRLRVAPLPPKGFQNTQHSVLELRPRYPLMGGWNYTFTLGYDAPLASAVGYDSNTGLYTLSVPIFTPIPGSVINHEELNIILPEGATDVQFVTPFDPLAATISTHLTYLDSTGRPAVTLQYKNLTTKHAGEVYVTYRVPFLMHIRKALSVGVATFSLFAFAVVFRRISFNIGSGSKKAQ